MGDSSGLKFMLLAWPASALIFVKCVDGRRDQLQATPLPEEATLEHHRSVVRTRSKKLSASDAAYVAAASSRATHLLSAPFVARCIAASSACDTARARKASA